MRNQARHGSRKPTPPVVRGTVPRAARARLEAVRGFVLDLDGTLVLSGRDGYRALAGAVEFVRVLRRRALPFVVFTNGTFEPIAEYVARLDALGIEITGAELMTPSVVAAAHLTRAQRRRVLVLGTAGVSQPLRDAGLDVLHPPDTDLIDAEFDAVYVGWHPGLRWNHVDLACRALWAGAAHYTASGAKFFASSTGRTVGISAAISAALTNTTGRRALVVGKPARRALAAVSARLGLPPESLAVVGDDPAVEPAFARAGGALSIGIRTGLGAAVDFTALPAAQRADMLLADLPSLTTLVDR